MCVFVCARTRARVSWSRLHTPVSLLGSVSKVSTLTPNNSPGPLPGHTSTAVPGEGYLHDRSFASPEGQGNVLEGGGEGQRRRDIYCKTRHLLGVQVNTVTSSITNSQSYITHVLTLLYITFTDSSTWSKLDQLSVNPAQRAHLLLVSFPDPSLPFRSPIF